MVCTPCKTSYNVLSHSHIMIWGLVQFVSGGGGGGGGGGGALAVKWIVQKRESPDF